MTIRYICVGCESVLRIKEEKAGSKGRCPRCKMEFVVPHPEDDDGTAGGGQGGSRQAAPIDDVDMPLELTPEIEDSPNSDSLDALRGAAATARAEAATSLPGGMVKKPSVAELMREFEAGKKKSRRQDSESEVSRPAATAVKTAGTATDALSRAYQQKRESASAPVVSAKEAKAAERRALLMQYLMKKAGPLLAVIFLLLSAYYWYMTGNFYSGVPLYPVSGKVVSQTGDVEGLRVLFIPVLSGTDDPRGSAEGVTAADGSFQLTYQEPHKGAPAGKYEITVLGKSGLPLILTDGTPMLTVSDTEENKFEIRL